MDFQVLVCVRVCSGERVGLNSVFALHLLFDTFKN